LYVQIRAQALAVGVGLVDHRRIDEINILQATYEAMRLALRRLASPAGALLTPQHLLLDAVRLPGESLPQTPIIHGDALSASIAAASIIAKVTRDRLMVEMDGLYPGYGFAEHKGYSCRAHWDALRRLGPSPIHRLTFAGVAHPDVGGADHAAG
ncbi:MAG: ribonuclease HII, partial [Bacillota bacterium]